MDFDTAFDALIGNEGGYVVDPADPGGETNWGISKRSYPAVDIKNLTKEGAKAIYLRDFWGPCGADRLPGVAFDLFDMAVNSGVKRAVIVLQQAISSSPTVATDGDFGPVTLARALAVDPIRLEIRLNAARLNFMTNLPGWPDFGKGWARRIASNLNRIGAN